MSGKVLTANLLREGWVVFLTEDSVWSDNIGDARLAETEEAQKLLEEKGAEGKASNLIVDPYLVDAVRVDGAIQASHIREQMRTLGPTVRRDLGKQANGSGGRFDAKLTGK